MTTHCISLARAVSPSWFCNALLSQPLNRMESVLIQIFCMQTGWVSLLPLTKSTWYLQFFELAQPTVDAYRVAFASCTKNLCAGLWPSHTFHVRLLAALNVELPFLLELFLLPCKLHSLDQCQNSTLNMIDPALAWNYFVQWIVTLFSLWKRAIHHKHLQICACNIIYSIPTLWCIQKWRPHDR